MKRLQFLLLPLLLLLAGGLGYTLYSMPAHPDELQEMVTNNLEASGVSNPVTAVLLNFRGYDTFLEMIVLLVALLGVWSLDAAQLRREPKPGPVLDTFARLLVPVLILVSGYLLWVGAHAPGGAFQAGSVLGAAGVLLLMTGWRLRPALAGLPLRISLVAGSATFLAVAGFTLQSEGMMLQYPISQAKTLILIIETVATFSIAVTLAALFLGNKPIKTKDVE